MNREIETGLVPINAVPKENPNIPKVTRNERGRILWKLPGNTPEQNEKLGIQNVQALFLEKFPVFNELFPLGDNGKIAEEKKEEAKKFILEKIRGKNKRKKEFNSEMIGTFIYDRKHIPYFEGSYFTAIRKASAAWGIDIDETDIGGYKRWTIEDIETEAREFLKREGDISASLLKKKGKSSLLAAIINKYPGKTSQLRIDFGLQLLHKPEGYWTFETVKKEATLFYQQFGDIDQKLLNNNGRSDLMNQIRFHYPGGLHQAQVDLGVKPKQRLSKPNGYWTPELILQEAIDFYTQYGSISQPLLAQHERADLIGAIENHYPGKMSALKEKLGITGSKSENAISPDQARKELWSFLEEEENG